MEGGIFIDLRGTTRFTPSFNAIIEISPMLLGIGRLGTLFFSQTCEFCTKKGPYMDQPLQVSVMRYPTKICGITLLVASLAGCGGADELSERIPNALAGTPVVFNDLGVINNSALNSALDVRTELRGVNSDGKNAVVRVSWALTDTGFAALKPNSRIVLRQFRNDTPTAVINIKPVSEDAPSGSVDVPVNTQSDSDTQWYLELDRANLLAVPDITTHSIVNVGAILKRDTTPLEQLVSVDVQLVEDSYTATNINNRREHNFALAVNGRLNLGQNPDNPDEMLTKPAFVTGLVDEGREPFTVIESGVVDTESPLMVTDERKDPLVYLVMDASSSLLQSECADDLYHAISSTVISLAPAVNFEYRIFDTDVYEVDSTLEFLPISGGASGSALYYALDTVAEDISKWEHSDRDIFVIAYSDGLDLASWNHYDFATRDDVVTHVGRRLSNLVQQHRDLNDRSLRTFLVGFDPRTGSEAEEMLFLATQGGGEYVQMDRDDCNASLALQNSQNDRVQSKIQETFLGLTDHIRSVYYLNYSSQQTHGRSSLAVELKLSDTVSSTIQLPARPVEQ